MLLVIIPNMYFADYGERLHNVNSIGLDTAENEPFNVGVETAESEPSNVC